MFGALKNKGEYATVDSKTKAEIKADNKATNLFLKSFFAR